MNRLSKILKASRMSVSDLDEIIDKQQTGIPTQSGIKISHDMALNFSAVFNANYIISNTVASLPCILYRRIDEHNKERATDHPLYDVLHNQPNPEMTSYNFREMMQSSLNMRGNACGEIITDKLGRTVEVWPWNYADVKVERDKETNKIIYRLRQKDGSQDKIYPAEKVFHVPGLGYDGRVGYSILQLARETMGLGLAMETFQARFYGAGTNIGGFLAHPGRLGDKALEHLQESIKKKYSGLLKSHGLMILEEGMKFEKSGMPLEDAQFLESRVFQIGEIARWFNLPPHKLKELTRATFSNIEEQQIEFVQDSIRPWLIRWEQHISWKLLTKEERKQYFAEFLVDGLLRGDTESRMKAYLIERQNGIIDANEWRARENRNPLEGKAGKAIWMPLNMIDANAPLPEPKAKEPFKPKQEGEEEKSLPNFELRALRSLKARRRIAEVYKEVFRAVEKDILSKEIPAVKKIMRKTLKTRDIKQFVDSMGEFYTEFREYVRQRFAGLFATYGEAIYPLAAEEIGASPDLTDEYRVYLVEHADHSTNRYIESSRGQLKSVAFKHRENDPVKAIEQRLAEWEEKRPDKIADLEVVNGECGTAQFVYYAAGLRTVWVTFDDSCPYCESLNGMTISRGMSFINAGTDFKPPGADIPLKVSQNISHPAAHEGCDCSVRAAL